MSESSAVVVDTMVVSSIVNAVRDPARAAAYRSLTAGRPIVVSFATVTEMRYGAIKAGWSELRRRGLERDLAKLVVVQPDDDLMQVCANLRAQCLRSGHGLGQKIHESDRWIAATAPTCSPQARTPASRPNASATHPSRSRSTSTATCSQANRPTPRPLSRHSSIRMQHGEDDLRVPVDGVFRLIRRPKDIEQRVELTAATATLSAASAEM